MINLKQKFSLRENASETEFAMCFLLSPQLAEIRFMIQYHFHPQLHMIEPKMR